MIRYTNQIPVEDYQRLRASVGWRHISDKQAENAVNNCFYAVCCLDDDRVIGITRLLWDGDYCVYLSDVIVEEPWRGRGIATHMIRMCLDHLHEQLEPGDVVKIFLMAAKGREGFYEQFGFRCRPNEEDGAGMEQWIEKR